MSCRSHLSYGCNLTPRTAALELASPSLEVNTVRVEHVQEHRRQIFSRNAKAGRAVAFIDHDLDTFCVAADLAGVCACVRTLRRRSQSLRPNRPPRRYSPRRDHVVLGSTYLEHDGDKEVRPQTTADIIARSGRVGTHTFSSPLANGAASCRGFSKTGATLATALVADCSWDGPHGWPRPQGSPDRMMPHTRGSRWPAEMIVDFFLQGQAPPPPPPLPLPRCPDCGGHSCDGWIAMDPEKYTCAELKRDWGCKCHGCSSCPNITVVTP